MRIRRGTASILSIATLVAGVLIAPGAVHAAPSSASHSHGWRFAPDINAPWATAGDDETGDTPNDAVGLCRSAPFNTSAAYAPTSNIDAIVGDPVNNSGASNFGCRTPQNETTIAVDPSNAQHFGCGCSTPDVAAGNPLIGSGSSRVMQIGLKLSF